MEDEKFRFDVVWKHFAEYAMIMGRKQCLNDFERSTGKGERDAIYYWSVYMFSASDEMRILLPKVCDV